jgi:hypothetical protein
MNYIDDIAQRIQSEVPRDALPDGDIASLFRLYALLALSKGVGVTPKDVHDAWSVWMSAENPDHSAIQPFHALSNSTRREDDVFVEAIRASVPEK